MPTTDPVTNLPLWHYAASVARSGVVGFPERSERDAWVIENNGFVVPRNNVDPEVRNEIEGLPR